MALVVFIAGLALGALGYRYYKPILRWLRPAGVALRLVSAPQRIGHDSDALQKNAIPAPFPDGSERVAVLLIAGQSLAANYGQGDEIATDPRILNFFRGKCFIARDPLLGATGPWQSPWIRTGHLLLASGQFEKVVIITTAAGGTGVLEWSGGKWPGRGGLNSRLIERIKEAKAAGLAPTHFLWHQGEHDAQCKTLPDIYSDALCKVINDVRDAIGVNIPAFIALATRVQASGSNERIRNAQRQVASSMPNAHIVIDSDALGFEHRYDGTHLFSSGLDLMAAAYANGILSLSSARRELL